LTTFNTFFAGVDQRHQRDKGKNKGRKRNLKLTRRAQCVASALCRVLNFIIKLVDSSSSTAQSHRRRGKKSGGLRPGSLTANDLWWRCSRVGGHYGGKTNTDLWPGTHSVARTPVSHSTNISGHLTLHRGGTGVFVFAGLHAPLWLLQFSFFTQTASEPPCKDQMLAAVARPAESSQPSHHLTITTDPV